MGNQGGAMKRQDTAAKNWVPNVEPTPVPAAPARPAPTVELVSGKVLDNLWGGVGVAVALSAIYALVRIALANIGMMPLPDLQHAAWAGLVFALVGLTAFGALTAWRASLDERERQGDINAMAARIADDDEYIDTLEAKVDEYRRLYENSVQDLAEARAALHQAMGRNSDRYRAPEQDPVPSSVERDAQFLLQLMYSGKPAGRKSVTDLYKDWTRPRWEAARDLLEAAGVVRTVGNQTEPGEATLQAATSKLGAYCHSEWDS